MFKLLFGRSQLFQEKVQMQEYAKECVQSVFMLTNQNIIMVIAKERMEVVSEVGAGVEVLLEEVWVYLWKYGTGENECKVLDLNCLVSIFFLCHRHLMSE